MTKNQLFEKVISYFTEKMPAPKTELNYKNSYELIVAVILSAQCTDKRVNQITPIFFEQFPNAIALSNSSVEQIYEVIKSCSYPNNKAKNLLSMAQTLIRDFGGQIPSETEELQKLPGVGRKTANVIASVAFNKAVLAVDTHVFRVANRLGLTTNSKNPQQSENDLMKYLKPEIVHNFHHWLILHGRYVCIARTPKCQECGLSEFCKYYQQKKLST